MNPSPRSSRPLLIAVLALASLTACDDDPASPGSPQDITISIDPASVALTRGEASSVGVTLESTGGFDESVTLIANGAPNGVAIGGGVIDGGSGMATLGIGAALDAALGTVTVTVSATGPGVAASTATFDVTIGSSGGFALTAAPDPVNMTQGTTETTRIGIARIEPFAGVVTLSVGNVPTGVTATLDSASVAGDAAILTLVADNTITGSYTLFVEGMGLNVASEAVAVTVNIFP